MAIHAFADHRLIARMSTALVLANARYWITVAPLVRTQLKRWTRRAEDIPDPTLRQVALANLREEGFNAQATATLATLAPRSYRKPAVEAIVGLQVIYDYLDSLVERPLADPLGDRHQLYRAFMDAVLLDREPLGEYYPPAHPTADGGYLRKLVSVVRGALARLPSQAKVAEVSAHAAARCTEAQVRAHATPLLGNTQLERWARDSALDTGVPWREFLAGSVTSGLALHALTVAAADPSTSSAQAMAVDEVYLSVCAVSTLLDGLVDYEQDLLSSQPGYARYYEDRDGLAQGLNSVIRRAVDGARAGPHEAHHLVTLVGVAAYYASAPTADSEFARPVMRQVCSELEPLIAPILAVMRSWRTAKRLGCAIANTIDHR